jgi:hypothetical protein
MRMTKKRALLYLVLLLLMVGLIPVKSLDAPLWKVSVVDESSQPVAGITVRESYQNYSAEFEGHEYDLATDAQGQVVFPPRVIWAPLALRALAVVGSSMGGVHASYGPHAWVFAFGGGAEGDANKNGFIEDWTGLPTVNESRIILHKSTIPSSAFSLGTRDQRN